MPSFNESAVINASPEKLWELMTTPALILQWFVGLDTLDVSADYPRVGSTQSWTYKTMGMEFKGTNKVLVSEPEARINYQLSGLMSGTMDYVLSETADGIQLDFEIDYEMSGGVLGKLATPVVHQMNIGNAKKSISNLKAMAEAG